MRRGEIWWVDLGEPRGAEPAFLRPVLFIQDDLLTESRLATAMVVPLTSSLRRALAVGNVKLEPRDTGLSKPSVALVCQVMTVDKSWLLERAGTLPRGAIRKVDAGLKLALGLSAA